jgi:Eukaryotic aspartyl protease
MPLQFSLLNLFSQIQLNNGSNVGIVALYCRRCKELCNDSGRRAGYCAVQIIQGRLKQSSKQRCECQFNCTYCIDIINYSSWGMLALARLLSFSRFWYLSPNLQFDTGSTGFWVRSALCTSSFCNGKPMFDSSKSSTFVAGTLTDDFTYGDGTTAHCVTSQDVLTFGSLSIPNQQVCEADSIVTTTAETDGIMGLGPPGGPKAVSDVTESLATANASLVSFWYSKIQDLQGNGDAGEITFGAMNTARFTGPIQWAGITFNRLHWTLSLSSISFADSPSTNILSSAIPVIVDTGTTVVILPIAVFTAINQKMGGIPFGDGTYRINCRNAKSLPPIVFNFGTVSLTLTWDQQLIISSRSCISIFQPTSSGIPSILGASFLANFYTSFDHDNARIGFAKAVGVANQTIPDSWAIGTSYYLAYMVAAVYLLL